MADLTGVAFVTGGGRGVGENIARGLAAAGMQVAIGARSRNEVEAVASRTGALPLSLDVTSAVSIAAAVEHTESTLGPIDLLVCNAGVLGPPDPFDAHSSEEWWRTFEVNVRGPYECCRAIAPGMMARGHGRIVNVGSGAAHLPIGRSVAPTAYAASKAALHRYTEVLAHQLEPHGVLVFSVSPGLVRSGITTGRHPEDAAWTSPDAAPALIAAIAAGDLDRLSGRFLHAEHDPPDDLRGRVDTILDNDLNAIRLRR